MRILFMRILFMRILFMRIMFILANKKMASFLNTEMKPFFRVMGGFYIMKVL